MRKTFKRIVACVLGASTIATPLKAWADPMSGDCSSYAQVESHATGGDYVGGRLTYETNGSVSRSQESTSQTTTTTGSGSILGGTITSTVTVTTSQSGSTTTTQEPIGFYSMNDGSMYEINCVTGDSKKVG